MPASGVIMNYNYKIPNTVAPFFDIGEAITSDMTNCPIA